jgi:hypothetical protein
MPQPQSVVVPVPAVCENRSPVTQVPLGEFALTSQVGAFEAVLVVKREYPMGMVLPPLRTETVPKFVPTIEPYRLRWIAEISLESLAGQALHSIPSQLVLFSLSH